MVAVPRTRVVRGTDGFADEAGTADDGESVYVILPGRTRFTAVYESDLLSYSA